MTSMKRHLTYLATALVFGALIAPSAMARPIDDPALPSSPQVYEATGQAPVQYVGASGGFDWGDAAIGAGAVIALVAIGVGAALLLGFRRSEQAQTSAA